jgi:hypothetical protein
VSTQNEFSTSNFNDKETVGECVNLSC